MAHVGRCERSPLSHQDSPRPCCWHALPSPSRLRSQLWRQQRSQQVLITTRCTARATICQQLMCYAQVCAAGPGLIQKLGRVLKEKAQGDLDRVFKGTSKTRQKLGVSRLQCMGLLLLSHLYTLLASFASLGCRRAFHLLVARGR